MVRPSPRRLTVDQARRIALAAQGLTTPHPSGAVDKRHFRRIFRTLGVLQLDSVNVVSRSHYLPVLARLGPYDQAKLDAYTSHPEEIFEYWGHEASLLPVDTYPLWKHRMDGIKSWARIRSLEAEHPGYVETVYDEIAAHGPMSVSDLADPGSRTGPWWGYSRGKIALEWLFAKGRIVAWRNRNFTRVYDIPERVLPRRVLQSECPDREAAYGELLVKAARHHGLGTAADLGDYYRLHMPTARPILEALADAGRIDRVDVLGWPGPVYAHPDATLPRRASVTALLSPFDSLVWNRDRTERLFGFRYRIEIYVPKEKRIHGYYVLPFLLDGRLVARVDLKADRKAGVLRVPGAFVEDGHDPMAIVGPLATSLTTVADWLGLGEVSVGRYGDLAAKLRNAL